MLFLKDDSLELFSFSMLILYTNIKNKRHLGSLLHFTAYMALNNYSASFTCKYLRDHMTG